MCDKNKFFIDVTKEICPITFVRVKIKLESMPSGKKLEVKCQGKEAFENICNSVLNSGHNILSKKSSPSFNSCTINIRKT
ncbi:MAG: hypothetical protein CFH01_00754 [Alphaproteobacteria bacterium MarineAlpha2_Bin1]|nr:MAG: hypothetical protein CFH01_00754 [Alphaproteobacteria bacterium MarineAlpha2_Bin1]|tara:strand:- start:237 stop:476 length:240 start_codon:yes stop_codon:yes gene_type:complete